MPSTVFAVRLFSHWTEQVNWGRRRDGGGTEPPPPLLRPQLPQMPAPLRHIFVILHLAEDGWCGDERQVRDLSPHANETITLCVGTTVSLQALSFRVVQQHIPGINGKETSTSSA
jgi:hypothetical protein